MPLGNLTKPEVRRLAREAGLPVAERPESQDFVEGGDYRPLLSPEVPGNLCLLWEKGDAAAAETARSRTASDLERYAALRAKEEVSQQQYDAAKAAADAAEAQVQAERGQVAAAEAKVRQKQAALDQANVDLQNTYIRAPVDGVVVSRNVDVGQTVAASLQAPTLFLIAQDLTKMQVDTSVDEADIAAVLSGLAGRDALRGMLSRLQPKEEVLLLGWGVKMPLPVRSRRYDQAFWDQLPAYSG